MFRRLAVRGPCHGIQASRCARTIAESTAPAHSRASSASTASAWATRVPTPAPRRPGVIRGGALEGAGRAVDSRADIGVKAVEVSGRCTGEVVEGEDVVQVVRFLGGWLAMVRLWLLVIDGVWSEDRCELLRRGVQGVWCR